MFAKKVMDYVDGLGTCREIDRTKLKHRFKFDVDIRKPSAPEGRNIWIYWGSHNTMQDCEKKIRKFLKKYLGTDGQARIVESKTGKILKVIK